MAKKSKIVKVKLASTASAYFYTTTKSAKMGKKLSKKKYDPIVRKHVLFEEKKIK
jgi:large subunit ribosomal protein L33